MGGFDRSLFPVFTEAPQSANEDGVFQTDGEWRMAYVAITLRCDEPGLSHANVVRQVD